MKKIISYAIVTSGIVLIVLLVIILQGSKKMYAHVNSLHDVQRLFPTTVDEMKSRVKHALDDAQQQVDAITTIAQDAHTFANTAQALDQLEALSNLAVLSNVIQILEMVSPDEAIRTVAQEMIVQMQDFFIEKIANNVALYNAFKEYVEGTAQHENLDAQQKYFLEQNMKGFEHSGLGLPKEKRDQVKQLQKDLATLTLQFDSNIAADQRTVSVTKPELAGLTDDFINQLKKDDQGNYLLGTDAPTVMNVGENCTVGSTRQKLLHAYMNRAFPVNDLLLKEIIAKRDQLAQVLGYESYAAYDIDEQMAGNPQTVQAFLDTLLAQVQKKADQEFTQLTQVLPDSVVLTPEGKLLPWDNNFLQNWYKIKYLLVDEKKVAEYFPMEKTVAGLLSIYEKFFSLKFKEIPLSTLWHKDLVVLAVYPAGKDTLLGYFILDLYPRPFKYTHACHATIIPATYNQDGTQNVALSVVIANFPRGSADKPSLLERKYVETFFHEFGHALHALLGRTKMASQAGTHVKTDFVEMPSQMLEEWLEDKDILKMISSHYITGEPLPDDLIERIISLKKFNAGLFLQRQLYFANLSLALFQAGAHKEPHEISKKLCESIRTHTQFYSEDHDYASFGHLTGYGAKYYGYLWSKVFALDLFDEIKKHGLLDPIIGKKYADEVIGKGGSVDPNKLLFNFLGRKPTQDAFLKDLGLQ